MLAALLAAALAGLLWVAPAAAVVSPCSPAYNGPGTVLPDTVVAPNLRLVRSSFSLGTCDEAIRVADRDGAGTLWGTDYDNRLWKSTDDGTTWTHVYTAADQATIDNVLPLSSGHLLIVARAGDGTRRIFRSTDATGTTFSGTASLTFPAGSRIHSSQSWVETGGAIYAAQYGDPAPPVHLYKSTDGGQTFSPVHSRSDVRHFHAVQADPEVAGRIWLMAGDLPAQSRLGYSDDGGVNFTWVSQGVHPQSRVLTAMFHPAFVAWGTDTPDMPSEVWEWARGTAQLRRVLADVNGPLYNSVSFEGLQVQLSAVERAVEDAYVGDEFVHAVTFDGSSWSETRTPWKRAEDNPGETSTPLNITRPDSRGRFWVSWYNLHGSEFRIANIQLQLDPMASFTGGVQPSFNATPAKANTGEAVAFDASASSSPSPGDLQYSWDFGDGSTATGVSPSHTFADGTHVVRLQVTDPNGGSALNADSAETTRTVTVGPGTATPAATTGAASGVDYDSATFHASASANGAATDVSFQYGTTTAYGSESSPAEAIGSGTSYVPAAPKTVSGLQPDTIYHYRTKAVNSQGTRYGADRVLRTDKPPPTVVTSAASSVTFDGATLNGSVNPNGLPTTYHFDYREVGTGSWTSTSAQSAGTGESAQPVSAPVSGLETDADYEFKLVADNSSGASEGSVLTFTAGEPPVVAASSATGVTFESATLHGSVNPKGSSTTYHFVWREVGAPSWTSTSSQNAGSGTTAVPVSAPVTGLDPDTPHEFRLVATNATGTATSSPAQQFATLKPPPTVVTSAASSVTFDGATLNGSVNPNGLATTYHFDYRQVGAPTWTSTPSQSAGSGTSAQGVSASVSGLETDEDYEFKLVASNSSGQREGATLTFTAGEPPGATTSAASGVTFEAATLNGSVNPKGSATSYHFEWREVGAAGWTSTASQSAGSGTTAVPVSAPVTGLDPDTPHEFRLVATNATGTATSTPPDQFATLKPPPTVATSAASSITFDSATLNGTVNPNGLATDFHFDYRKVGAPTWTSTADQSAGSGTSAQTVSASVSGLETDAQYEFKLVAANSSGEREGTALTFTPGEPPIVATTPASGVTSSAATLHGSVDPRGSPTTYRFDYRKAGAASWSPTGTQSAGSGSSAVAVSTTIGGLDANSDYEFRVVAANVSASREGAAVGFRTGPTPPGLAVLPPAPVAGLSAVLRGRVNPGGGPTTYHFEYGPTTAYGSRTGEQAGNGTGPLDVSAQVFGLRFGTTYHARLVATNATATVVSDDVQFRTAGAQPTGIVFSWLALTRRAGRVLVRLRCPGMPGAPQCRGRVDLAALLAGTTRRRRVLTLPLGTTTFRLPRGRTRTYQVRISTPRLRNLRRRARNRRVNIRVVMTHVGTAGTRATARRSFRVRLPPA